MLKVGDVIEIKWEHCPDDDGKHKKEYKVVEECGDFFLHRMYKDNNRYAFRTEFCKSGTELMNCLIKYVRDGSIIWFKVKEVF